MTMDWTVEQIFSELQTSGERIQQEQQHLEQRNIFGHKYEEEFPTTSDYMDDLDDILNHHDDQWNDQFQTAPMAPTTASAQTATRTDDFWPAPIDTTTVLSPTATRHDDFRQTDLAGGLNVSDNEEMDPTPSMLPYLPSPPPLQPSVPGKPTLWLLFTEHLFYLSVSFGFKKEPSACSYSLHFKLMSCCLK